ncbi:MAG: hypothetical protein HKN44_06785 [Ilumatobacter sp.]|nr:hypothetical protein [Ilumatobacter sp.]
MIDSVRDDPPPEPVSALQSGAHLDHLAALEEERRFLLRSLDDLEREHAAGDVDDENFATLRDGYTVRAAAVLREIESGRSRLAPRSPRRWARTVGVVAALAALAVGIGFALASAFGERRPGQEITGFTPGDDARTVLAAARTALNQRDFGLANALYANVVEMERERGVDSAEAITYFGWTLALQSVQDPDETSARDRLDAARIALRQATVIDADYADPNCFLAIVEYNFFDDADAALPHIDACQALDPPADVAELVAGFADEIRSAAS